MIRRASSLSRLSSSAIFTTPRFDSFIRRESVIGCEGIRRSISTCSRASDFKSFTGHFWQGHCRSYEVSDLLPQLSYGSISRNFSSVRRSFGYGADNVSNEKRLARDSSNAYFEMNTDGDVVRFNTGRVGSSMKLEKARKDGRVSKTKKVNELRFDRLKVEKEMNSPSPIVRDRSNASFELNTDGAVVRFNTGDETGRRGSSKKLEKAREDGKVSVTKKVNELRFDRLKAKKEMNSPSHIVRDSSNASFELNSDGAAVRFNTGDETGRGGSSKKLEKARKDGKVSKTKKVNELRFDRLKAEKKMNSPSPIVRDSSDASFELNTDGAVVRFNTGDETGQGGSSKKLEKARKDGKVSKTKKVNELRFYRLKAKKKMNSPSPIVRMTYKLEKAKRKEVWLIEKLRNYEAPIPPPETHDPEILTEEERFYLKRTGEKKKNYVPVGRRGVFGGVVLNMHLHWKNHETVKVVCKPCRPGQVHQYAEELARLSQGVVIDIMPNDIVILYRGKNYVRPDVMSPPYTLSKAKALEKYRYEQSLEHTGHFIEKLELELEQYLEHVAQYRKEEKSDLAKAKS